MSIEQHLTEALGIWPHHAIPVMNTLRSLATDGLLVLDFRDNPAGDVKRLRDSGFILQPPGRCYSDGLGWEMPPHHQRMFVLERTEEEQP